MIQATHRKPPAHRGDWSKDPIRVAGKAALISGGAEALESSEGSMMAAGRPADDKTG